MEFALTGFAPDAVFRVFQFDGIKGNVRQSGFSVRTDLSLVRKYSIALQDLPVLCRKLLEDLGEGNHSLTFTEDQMRTHAQFREAEREVARNKKSMRRIPLKPGAPRVQMSSAAAAVR